MPPPHIALLGGINMDVSVHAHSTLRAGDSNPGRVQCSPGGVARNVAENLLRLGLDARLLGVAPPMCACTKPMAIWMWR